MMKKLAFWRRPSDPLASGARPSGPRRASRRVLLRTICALAMAVLIYHVLTSVDLRRQIKSSVPSALGGSGTTRHPVAAPSDNKAFCKIASLEDAELLSQDSRVQVGKENATLVMLVRNSELRQALGSMRDIEDRFNHKFRYPWTFMNDQPFTDEFKAYTTGMASGHVEYHVISKNHWSIPETVNRTTMQQGMRDMTNAGIIYGGSESYRHMCRFNSGFFYEEEPMKKYEWYWRVEPSIEFWCDLTYDPFTFMRENNKVYGFVITMYEFLATIPTLWGHTKEFVKKNPYYLAEGNSLDWLVDGANSTQAGDTEVKGDYNLCHFWSNFEIGSLSFYRSDSYRKYFDYLDSTGGFFYERWGDAPVHSIALSLFLHKDRIHHFADLGYNHAPAARCPQDDDSHTSGRCYCDRSMNFDLDGYSCTPRWFKLNGYGKGAVFPK